VTARRDTPGPVRPAARPEAEPKPRRGVGAWIRGAFFDHLVLKALAVVLTLTVFLLVGASDEEREIMVSVGIDYVLPPGKVLVSERVDEVRLTIKGPWRRIKRFDTRELRPVTLDVSKVSGGEVAISPDMLHIPDGLSVTSVIPRSVRVAFENRITKDDVEIAPGELTGRPAAGFVVDEKAIVIEPPTVNVRGPASAVLAMSQVRTQDLPVGDHNQTFTVEATLLPPEGVEVDWKGTVKVTIPLVGRWIGVVPVAVVTEEADLQHLVVEPAVVEVELRGARTALDRLLAGGIRPTVKVSKDAATAAGVTAEVAVDGVPSGVQVEVHPPEVRVRRK